MTARSYRLKGFLDSVGANVIWESSRDVKLLLLLRFVRLLGYGGTTFVLALYLNAIGFEDHQVGLFMTLTLVGDLGISFALTYVGDRMGVRLTAIIGASLMCAGGLAFAWFENFWLLLIASVVGVINSRCLFFLFFFFCFVYGLFCSHGDHPR